VRRSLRGLDWLNFFVANVQTGFGPFIAVYLTANKWTQAEIGSALSVGTVAFMASQLPAGAVVDAARNKRLAAAVAGVAVAASALLFAILPDRLPVLLAEVLHGFASCVLTPALAALSLALVGRARLGERLGRNARFASLGNGSAAAVMGALGTYVSSAAVFWLTAALMAPALLALGAIRPADFARPRPSRREVAQEGLIRDAFRGSLRLLRDRRMVVFALCCVLFHLANAAMLPLAAGEITKRVGSRANLVIAACIVVPQLVVALFSPLVGRLADRWGRRPVLALGFAALPLRGALLTLVHSPLPLIAVQALDGVSGAVFGVMLPLVCADITRGTLRLNLGIGVAGLASGLGATIGTTAAGEIADSAGLAAAFLALSGAGLLAVALIVLALPETRPPPGEPDPLPPRAFPP
jgi:MFS family permease